MFTAEDLVNWNEIFDDCKIHEADLAQPTESFLTRVLVAYLEMFGFNVVPPYPLSGGAVENTRQKRVFLRRLAAEIDNILKVTSESYNFTYFDLIKPTPKKTSHLLSILLNYLHYFNMFRQDVFTRAKQRKKKRAELAKTMEEAQKEHKETQEKAEEIQENLVTLVAEVPKAQEELEILQKEDIEQKSALVQLQDSVKALASRLDEQKARKTVLNKQTLPNEEAHELQSVLNRLEGNIIERKNLAATMQANIEQHREHTQELQLLLKDIEDTKETVQMKLWNSFNEISGKLEEAKRHMSDITSRKDDLLQQCEEQKSALSRVEISLHTRKLQFGKQTSQKSKLIGRKNRVRISSCRQLAQIKEEDHALECELEEQHDVRDFLQENIDLLLSGEIHTAFDD